MYGYIRFTSYVLNGYVLLLGSIRFDSAGVIRVCKNQAINKNFHIYCRYFGGFVCCFPTTECLLERLLLAKSFYQFSLKNWQNSRSLPEGLSHDSTLGELLFDFGRVLMDSNDKPRVKKADIDKYNVETIKRNLNIHTMYQRPEFEKDHSKLPANEDLTDLNLTNNFIAVSSFLEATHNFTDPANFHNIALCFYKESQRASRPSAEKKILAQKSEDFYRKAIDLNPIYAQSLSNLGYLKALRGEYEDAKSMLDRAARLKDGRPPTTYLGLAIIEQSKGNYLGALESSYNLRSGVRSHRIL